MNSTIPLEAGLILLTCGYSYLKLWKLNSSINNFINDAYLSLIILSGLTFLLTVRNQPFVQLLFSEKKQYRFQVDSGLLLATLLPTLIASSKLIVNSTSAIWTDLLLLTIINGFTILTHVILKQMKLPYSLSIILLIISKLWFNDMLQQIFIKKSYLILSSITLFHMVQYLILNLIPTSFTLAELSILAQALSFLTIQGYMILIKSNNIILLNLSEEIIILNGVVIGMLIIGVIFTMNCMLMKNKNKIINSLLFYMILSGGIGFIIFPFLNMGLKLNPFLWIFNYILKNPSAQLLIIYWIIAILIGVIYSQIVLESNSLNNRRKYFHGLATLLFIPGYFIDKKLLYVAFSIALSLFLLLEYIRYFKILPFDKVLNNYLIHFTDDKDTGNLIFAHVYLLLGCALPIWLKEDSIACSLSGILVLGLADAAASIIGKKFGKTKWVGSNKTIKGTVGFILALLASFLLIEPQICWQIERLFAIILISVLNGLLEAWSYQNDNLILPLYLFSTILLFC
ncbi:hypothetical protein K502DRAFT_364926 [Neoconidiobolus thromboides FSU 785]|nr:hypothetical protein K502DRAFT_364926 [Neoconidiobolus thromboides FSU 785]